MVNLSKSRYTRGVQCPKMLWMEVHRPELFDGGVYNQAVLETGNAVGDLAMGYFGDFVEIPFDAHDFEGMARRTRELVEQGTPVICEATFEHEGNLCMVDILRVAPEGVHLVEVKSSTHVHEVYLHDMAYQCWLLERCGHRVLSASLMHVDNEYVRHGTLDLNALFKVEDCTEVVFGMLPAVGERVSRLKEVASREDEPLDIRIGTQCASPYPCGFRAHCWRHVPSPGVFDLGGYGIGRALKLYEQGLETFDDLMRAQVKLSGIAKRQVQCAASGEDRLVNVDVVRRFLKGLAYPLYFLDFETYQPAVPPFDGVRPYQQIPTQYSLHVVHDGNACLDQAAPGTSFEHFAFLAEAGTDPRRGVAEALVRDVPADVTVVAYNMSFERMVLRDLAAQFPDLAGHLMSIHDNMADLIVPFRKGDVYLSAQGGSCSIKAVLPALFPHDPELSYEALDGVHNGAEASAAFSDLQDMTPEEAAKTRAALLHYCELDTLAMVRIWQRLRSFAEVGEVRAPNRTRA